VARHRRPGTLRASTWRKTLTICNLLSLWFAHVAERRQQLRAYNRDRLLRLYRPLAALFLTRHITVCTGISSPYLRHRVENAWEALGASGPSSRPSSSKTC